MPTDDSRGLETPDRGDVSTDSSDRNGPKSGWSPKYRIHLEVIDAAVRGVVGELGRLDREGALDRGTQRVVREHLRTIRSEALSAGRLLWEASERREAGGAGTVRGAFDADPDETDRDAAPGGVPMIVRRGRGVNSVIGPDPDVFDRERDRGSEDD
ncbi:hypothetical protein [Natrinema caseinilyticum]|uniref:hypothetical protein n=1 Tax=Natrinema caseinilyticum TaxID=2961570 RepID=UPI0020C3AD70|nr:hypothetical protein [Natrinema caseinilyticum]